MKFDGIVDRYLNRKVSVVLTRLFLRLGLSPNAVTVLSLVIGLLAAAAIAVGSYAAGILGSLLFQLSAIIDCCDGEVARLTHTESAFGEQLDLVADNIVHIAVFAGVAWAVYLREAALNPLVLGAAAVLGIYLMLVLAFGEFGPAAMVMANLPLALIGGVLAVVLHGDPLSVGSLVGFITLFGIATRNGIMVIYHIRHLQRAEGATLEEAVERGKAESLDGW